MTRFQVHAALATAFYFLNLVAPRGWANPKAPPLTEDQKRTVRRHLLREFWPRIDELNFLDRWRFDRANRIVDPRPALRVLDTVAARRLGLKG